MQNSLVTFGQYVNGAKTVNAVTRTSKMGIVFNGVMPKKEFRTQFPALKGNALSEAYNAMIKACGANAAGNLTKELVSGALTIKSERVYKDGARMLHLVPTENLQMKTVAAPLPVAKMDDTTAQALLVELQARFAKSAPTINV